MDNYAWTRRSRERTRLFEDYVLTNRTLPIPQVHKLIEIIINSRRYLKHRYSNEVVLDMQNAYRQLFSD